MNFIKADERWIGAFYKVLACFFYAILNVLVKSLSSGYGGESPLDPSQILCIQNFVAYFVIIPNVMHKGLASLRTNHISMHGVRVVCGVIGILSLYYAFSYLPVSQAVALGFLGPIFTVMLGWVYLKEPFGVFNTSGVFLGIVGAFFISRPDRAFADGRLSVDEIAYLFPVMSALCFAVCKILGRELALRKESTAKITNYLLLFSAPISLIPALAVWKWPSLFQWSLLFSLGIVAWLGHYFFAKSYAYAGVVFLMPFGFARLLISSIFAYILFSEVPKNGDTFWWGCLVVFISTTFICMQDERKPKMS